MGRCWSTAARALRRSAAMRPRAASRGEVAWHGTVTRQRGRGRNDSDRREHVTDGSRSAESARNRIDAAGVVMRWGSRRHAAQARVVAAGAGARGSSQIVFFNAVLPVSQAQPGEGAVEGGDSGVGGEAGGQGRRCGAGAGDEGDQADARGAGQPPARHLRDVCHRSPHGPRYARIDQGEAPSYYFEKFPEDNPVFGFIKWWWILTPGFDHMFSSPVFLSLLVPSFMACTYTSSSLWSRLPEKWSFMHSGEIIRKQEFADYLRSASIQDYLGVILMGAGYEVFKGSVDVPRGLNFVIGDVMKPRGVLSVTPNVYNTEVHVSWFYMEYYDSGESHNFTVIFSLFDLGPIEVIRKTIKVNDPLRYGGITIYQTDWGFSAPSVKKNGQGPFNLAMAPLKLNDDKKLFGTFLPIEDS
ncbi:hypothetical protein ACP4OV_020612 [Aristida adscensionis]